MPDPKFVQMRMDEAKKRANERPAKQIEFRSVEALELIADNLIDIRDILAEIRMAVISLPKHLK